MAALCLSLLLILQQVRTAYDQADSMPLQDSAGVLGATVAQQADTLPAWCDTFGLVGAENVYAFEARLVHQQSPLLRKLSNNGRCYRSHLDGLLAASEVKSCLISMLCNGVVRLFCRLRGKGAAQERGLKVILSNQIYGWRADRGTRILVSRGRADGAAVICRLVQQGL